MKSKKVNYFKIIGHLLVILSFYFIIRRFMSFDLDWSTLLSPKVILFSLLSILFAIVNVYISAFLWKNILSFLACKKIAYFSIYPVYVKSNIIKYLPGGIMNYVSRNVLCKDMGLSQIQIATSSAVELGIGLFINMVLSLLVARRSLISVLQKYIDYKQILLIFFIAAFVALLIILFFILYKKSKIEYFMKTYFNFKFVKLIFFNSSIVLLIAIIGLILFLFTLNAITPISLDQAIVIGGGNIVAFWVGFLTPGAPGGIGIREAAFTFLMQDVCDMNILLVLAVLQRLIAVLSDIIAYGIELILEIFSHRAIDVNKTSK